MAKSIKTVDIHFRHAADKRRKWHKQGKPLRSLTYAPWFEYEFMDHQIVSLPFCRLHNVSSKTRHYSKTCSRALDWTIPARAGVCFRPVGDQIIDEFDDIDLFFSKLNDCFVYRVEKGLPGEAARELRYQLERWVKAGMQKDTVKFDIYFLPLPLSSYPPVSKIMGLVHTAVRQHPWRHPQYAIIAVGRSVEFYKWDAAKSVPVLYTGMYDLLAQSATIHERLMEIREERLAGR
ncbi:hypothetical protein IFM61606_04550 [Aspergillus udagawae]|uniref:Uncharacterized protein n=1 Tax=Aspergillus udagawae TaxID=91492 RepID=A0ABQ1ATJ4_9EURO|nr:hypothetical protein IFM51744_06701 [Aspergillus udagawae]GFF87804.1 hypothetical protein IFM53868_05271 [Aspergillus udagawae]GFG24635.1 hypothetical protein IFM61606_04550 [Aspergillus udagawae]